MSANSPSHTRIAPLYSLLTLMIGSVALAITLTMLRGRPLPFFDTPRIAFAGVLIVGVLMCAAFKADEVRQPGYWLNPFVMTNSALGLLAVTVAVLYLVFGAAPGVTNGSDALLVVVSLIGLKWALTALHRVARGS